MESKNRLAFEKGSLQVSLVVRMFLNNQNKLTV